MSATEQNHLEPALEAFAHGAIKRERVFLIVTWVGVCVGLGLAGWYAFGPVTGVGATEWVIVVLVLLNARQNLRQVKYARALAALMDSK